VAARWQAERREALMTVLAAAVAQAAVAGLALAGRDWQRV
jgi:hypothetical protein